MFRAWGLRVFGAVGFGGRILGVCICGSGVLSRGWSLKHEFKPLCL